MTKAMRENINTMLTYRGRIFLTLIVSIIFLLPMYANLLHSTVVNVVEREKVIKEIRENSTELSTLESNYFSLKNKINMDLARSKGFEDGEVSSFISKKSLTAFVSHNEL